MRGKNIIFGRGQTRTHPGKGLGHCPKVNKRDMQRMNGEKKSRGIINDHNF
jgi:hypothetical protein